jgi:hypothetical protein
MVDRFRCLPCAWAEHRYRILSEDHLRCSRSAAATFRTRVKFLHAPTETRIYLRRLSRIRAVHQLVAVAVHLCSAVRTMHLLII